MKYLKNALLILFFSISTSFPHILSAQELGLYEKLDNYLPTNLEFINEAGDTIILNDLIDKPTVISLVYYECPGLCSPLLEGIADVITRAKLDLGTEYQFLTISFDPTESTELAMQKKATYSELVENKDTDNGWKFFTGTQENIDNLLNALGYQVKKEGDDFIHPAAIIVVSPEGKITRYLHGVYFLPFDLKMAIVEAHDGKSGPTINKVLQFCFSYDAEGKKYVFNVTKISGSIILLLAFSLFGGLVFKNRIKKQKV